MEENKEKISDFHGKTALIVDDNFMKIEILKCLLEKVGIVVIQAKNGKDAVEMYDSNPKIDIIFMDNFMPVMTGFEATGIIRKKNNKIPIVSTSSDKFQNEESEENPGFSGYMNENLSSEKLQKLLYKLL